MKKLPLKSPAFIYLEKAIREWLDVLGYAKSTLIHLPLHIREFLHWLEQPPRGITDIKDIDTPLMSQYYQHLTQRPLHKKCPGNALANATLNVHRQALNKLLEYLRKNANIVLPALPFRPETADYRPVQPLTIRQVQQLYEATKSYANPLLALRDRACLALIYDCGLRNHEAINISINDCLWEQRLLKVRITKGGQPRFVPFSQSTITHLMDYAYEARPRLRHVNRNTPIFLLTNQGYKGNEAFLGNVLNNIRQHADTHLKHLHLYPHLFRHSIATHLLYQGMSLENLAQFLGHKSLESTQQYTHILEDFARQLSEIQTPDNDNTSNP